MPAGTVTGRHLHGNLQGYVEASLITAGTWVPYVGPQAPVNAIITMPDTAAGGVDGLTVDYTPGTGANAGKLKVFATSVGGYTVRITWIYPGG